MWVVYSQGRHEWIQMKMSQKKSWLLILFLLWNLFHTHTVLQNLPITITNTLTHRTGAAMFWEWFHSAVHFLYVLNVTWSSVWQGYRWQLHHPISSLFHSCEIFHLYILHLCARCGLRHRLLCKTAKLSYHLLVLAHIPLSKCLYNLHIFVHSKSEWIVK